MKLLVVALAFLSGVSAINLRAVAHDVWEHIKTENPLSIAERDAVGTALTNALGVLNGDQKPASKLVTCLKLFPNKRQEGESDALWNSCKDVITPGTAMNLIAMSELYFFMCI